MKALAEREIVRFLAVGVVNTAVGSAIMFGLYNLAHLPYWVSSGANYALTSMLSFFLNKYFTFHNTEKSAAQVFRFALHIVLCYLLAYGLARPLCRALLAGAGAAVRDNCSLFAGMCLFTGFNYIGQRQFAFRDRK